MVPEQRQIISGGLLCLLAGTLILLYKTRHLSWRANVAVGDGVRAIIRQDHRDLGEARVAGGEERAS